MFVFAESRLTRKTPASYADKVYMLAGQNRPSARTLSEALLNGNDGIPSARNRTAMLAFFGEYKNVIFNNPFTASVSIVISHKKIQTSSILCY